MALRTELNEQVLERKEVIDGSLIALASQLNVFILGKPGTAKSYLINKLCEAVTESKYFEYLMMKDTKREEFFGPLRISQLSQDIYSYNIKDQLPEAHIAFLDEIWKCNSAMLNTLLKALNEKKFRNNNQWEDMPLISCFSASNELPEDSSLNALYDRFLLRYEVNYIADKENFKKLIACKNEKIKNTISLSEIIVMQKEVENIEENNIPDLLAELQDKFMQNGLEYSDRRWKASVKVLKASAWLSGRNEVTHEDIEKLEAIFWDKPEQKREVRKILLSFSNPDLQAALVILDEAQSIYDETIKTAKQLHSEGKKAYTIGGEANDKINDCKNRLARLSASTKRDEILEQIKSIGKDIQVKCLGI